MEKDVTNWKGCLPPEKIVLEGQFVTLEPFNAEKHEEELYQVTIESEEKMRFLWDSMPKNRQDFKNWLKATEENGEVLLFVVIDKATGKVGGRQTFWHINANHGTVEIGGLLRGFLITKKPGATEAIYLFLRYIFDDLGYRRIEWKCHADNKGSVKAALRYGFKYEATFRNHYVMKGKSRDSCWFSIIIDEWPLLKIAYEQWLSPENFSSDGNQKRKLEEFQLPLRDNIVDCFLRNIEG